MNRSDVHTFLIQNNLRKAPDWNEIKSKFQPQELEVNGHTVYLFHLSFDMQHTPIEDQIVVSQSIPASYVPIHVHDYIEMVYTYQGRCTIVMPQGEIPISEGEIILIDKQTPHTLRETSSADVIIEIKLKKDYLSSSFLGRFRNKSTISQFLIDSLIDARRANNYLYFPLENSTPIRDVVTNLIAEYFDRDFCSGDLIDSYMFILFTELIRNSHNQTSNHAGNISPKDAVIIKLLRYMEEHYRDCSLTGMGDYFTFHPNYISALLKKATGKSFMELLQQVRLSKAAIYLANSSLPIPDIAAEVGYSSVSFFHKKFKEFYLVTPNDYRENSNKTT